MDKKVTYRLVAKYFTGNCTEAEKLQVENWRDTQASNLTAFNQYRAIWENAQKPADVFSPNVDQALDKVSQKLTDITGSEKRNKSISLITYTRRIAAAILVGTGIWLAYTIFHNKQEPDMIVSVSNTKRTEITLSDGTHIWMNTNTMLHYPETFKGKERKIYIEGEAYFDVAKNAKIPFVIETSQSIVRVVGTEFNLRARKNEKITIIAVNEGKVSFAGKAPKVQQPVYLLAGDKGTLQSDKQKLIAEKNQNSNFFSWKTGILVFNGTPLEKVASDLSDYFGTKIEVINKGKLQTPFTSTFDHKSMRDVLTILELSLGVKADTTGKTVVLK
jgi:transmembrane sensor